MTRMQNAAETLLAGALPGIVAAALAEELAREGLLYPDTTAETSDGTHTFAELYDYRMLYHAHAANLWAEHGTYPVVKSWRHHDGEECFGGGWFIVVAALPEGQVSNHYPGKDWDRFRVPEVPVAPEWDGHTPPVAADRLRAALNAPPLPEPLDPPDPLAHVKVGDPDPTDGDFWCGIEWDGGLTCTRAPHPGAWQHIAGDSEDVVAVLAGWDHE